MYNYDLSYLIFLFSHNNSFLCFALYFADVTPLRGWEITSPLVDECGCWVGIQSKSRHIRGGKKQNRQWTARFLESYQSLSEHNSTSATCYLLYARSIRPSSSPFRCPQLITMEIHRYAIDTRGILTSVEAMCVNVFIARLFACDIHDLRENRAGEISVFMFFNRVSIEETRDLYKDFNCSSQCIREINDDRKTKFILVIDIRTFMREQ